MGTETVVMLLKPLALAPLPSHPLVSVVMANHNYGRFIGDAIESVLAQTYPTFELIVCDDGSTDDSTDIVTRYARQDERVRLVVQSNGGQSSAWNTAVQHSRGDVIAFLDSDDIWLPEMLASVAAAFASRPQAGICVHQIRVIDSSRRPLRPPAPGRFDQGWLAEIALARGGWGIWPPSSGISLRREIAEELFPIPNVLGPYCDVYLLGAGQFLTEFIGVEQALAQYRLHGRNSTSTERPNLPGIERHLDLHELVVLQWHDYVGARFGPEVARPIRIDRAGRDWYWELLLTAYLLHDRPERGERGYQPAEMIGRLASANSRRLWRMLLALPVSLSIPLLGAWWTRKPWWALRESLADRRNRRRQAGTVSRALSDSLQQSRQEPQRRGAGQ